MKNKEEVWPWCLHDVLVIGRLRKLELNWQKKTKKFQALVYAFKVSFIVSPYR